MALMMVSSFDEIRAAPAAGEGLMKQIQPRLGRPVSTDYTRRAAWYERPVVNLQSLTV